MWRCVLRESWQDFVDSKFFEESTLGCMSCIILCGTLAIGYGLWKLFTWLFSEQVVAFFLFGVLSAVAIIVVSRLLWRGIVAIKENITYCRTRQ